jgi:hypothetical protein
VSLGIDFRVFDFQKEYKQRVVDAEGKLSKVEGSAMPARRATLDSTPAAPEGKQ